MSGRLPPYGREVATILRNPDQLKRYAGCTSERASIWVATGWDAWEWRYLHPCHLVIVLPEPEDPADFNWSFIHGNEPALLVGCGGVDRRQSIARAMFRDGVTAILAGGILMKTTNHKTPRVQ